MTFSNYQPRVVSKDERSNLSAVIPLRTPYVVMIDPASVCNLKCLFCPTGDAQLIKSTGRYQGLLSEAIFAKLIDGISEFKDPVKVLRLYKEGEPLLNKNFIDFVKLARSSRNIKRIDTTTNGLPLNPDLNYELSVSGINQINVSVNGMSDETYFRLTKKRVNTRELFSNIVDLCKKCAETGVEVYVKAIRENLSDAEQKEFVEYFSQHAQRIYFEGLQPNWPNFEFDYITPEYTTGHYGQPLENRDVCPFIFYMMVVNADGSVSACVQDWQHEMIMGDLRTESLDKIWRGEKLYELQRAHLEMRRNDYRNCSVCPVLRHGALDNIDSLRKTIALRLER